MNHLAHETSPYLLQHARNPVDWYPWGKEALERARSENKLIFLSIGYAACHWCHVMEHESFENAAIAKLMNERFVCIKVDREERPDLDEIYMAATQAMTGRGGWPMSVWLLPSLEPIYAGTYFPPEDRHGTPGFTRVLEHVDRLWKEKQKDLVGHGKELSGVIARHLAPTVEPGESTLAVADRFTEVSRGRFDRENGGWGDAPKFPHASELMVLLRHHARTGEPDSLHMVEKTLEKMAKGGMYDQLGGGFARYSTDALWLVPHFEKMLYDNALLARVYAEAYTLTKKPLYARIVRETLDYLLREMRQEPGGFSASQDADSEGVEGKFFVWSKAEIDAELGADAAAFCAHFGVTEHGNWEHANVLSWVGPGDALPEKLAAARDRLFAARAKRVHPATDDKVLAAWNGMAIAALAAGHQALGEQRWLDAARGAAAFVLQRMRDDRGRLLRTWRGGQAKLAAYLEDYGFMAEALLVLYECDFDPRWLAESQRLCDTMREHFRDPRDGSFFYTADDHEQLIARSKSVSEASQPSGVAMAALAFLRLGLALGDDATYAIGVEALRGNHEMLEKAPNACPALVVALELHKGDPREVVIAGEPGDARTQALLAKARSQFPPHRVVHLVHAKNRAALEKQAPLVAGKTPLAGQPAAYVCRRGACEKPVTEWK